MRIYKERRIGQKMGEEREEGSREWKRMKKQNITRDEEMRREEVPKRKKRMKISPKNKESGGFCRVSVSHLQSTLCMILYYLINITITVIIT